MGSYERFESLMNFWRFFPNTNLLGHPREWRIKQESAQVISLRARARSEIIISLQIKGTRFFISSPVDKQNQEQLKISGFLVECLADTLCSRQHLFQSHAFFGKISELFVIVFPLSLIRGNPDFQYLNHLDASNRKWISDSGYNRGIPTVRLVFNEELVFEAFRQTKDGAEEVSLLLNVISSLNKLVTDNNIAKIEKSIIRTSELRPRFKLYWKNRDVSFPEFVSFHEPNQTHHKLAAKRIAELAKELGLAPGYYEVEEAKKKIDALRMKVIGEVDSIVARYDLETTIPFLLTQLDALTNNYESNRSRITMSLEHQVDYNRQEELATEHTKYLRLHRNNRYLIEKFVQISAKRRKHLELDEYLFLVALIDLLLGLYHASDNLHYGLSPLGLNITDEYLFEVSYKENDSEQQDLFFKEKAELHLGLKGNSADQTKTPHPIEEFLSKLDTAFKQDLHFGFKDMINLLQVLSLWADFTKVKLDTYYSAKVDLITQTCSQNIIGFDQKSLEVVLDFLTLKQSDITHIIGQEKPCDDLPVWEINKRFSRYTVRPLIKIGETYYWGPYSMMKTGLLWTNRLSEGGLPFDIQGKNIEKVVQEERSSLDKELENKTYEIVKRFTHCVERNVDLFKRDRNGGHPRELGDFDVLSYHPEANVILNIECKHLPEEFCLKDMQRLRRTIFDDYLVKFNKRQQYLAKNYSRVMQAMGWTLSKSNSPKIIAVFLTEKLFWWTRFPPKGLNTSFVQIELLSEFIAKLQLTS